MTMLLPQKAQYALRALFELSLRYDEGPVKTSAIARAQVIPHRFLEAIMHQLRLGGFVDSKRGAEGGYYLARMPEDLTIGDVLRYVQGPLGPVECMAEADGPSCPLAPGCVFLPVWRQVRDAVEDIYNSVTFQTLVEQHQRQVKTHAASYAI